MGCWPNAVKTCEDTHGRTTLQPHNRANMIAALNTDPSTVQCASRTMVQVAISWCPKQQFVCVDHCRCCRCTVCLHSGGGHKGDEILLLNEIATRTAAASCQASKDNGRVHTASCMWNALQVSPAHNSECVRVAVMPRLGSYRLSASQRVDLLDCWVGNRNLCQCPCC
jgi:hypothetical protein